METKVKAYVVPSLSGTPPPPALLLRLRSQFSQFTDRTQCTLGMCSVELLLLVQLLIKVIVSFENLKKYHLSTKRRNLTETWPS